MIIHDFNVVGVTLVPKKADAPLVVDADAMLPFSIALQRFQTIARRSLQITQFGGEIQLPQLPLGYALEGPKAFDSLPGMKLASLRRPERLDHDSAYNARR
jgi:hypothetical protein